MSTDNRRVIGACWECGSDFWYPTKGKTEAGQAIFECQECGELCTEPGPADEFTNVMLMMMGGLMIADVLAHSEGLSEVGAALQAALTDRPAPTP